MCGPQCCELSDSNRGICFCLRHVFNMSATKVYRMRCNVMGVNCFLQHLCMLQKSCGQHVVNLGLSRKCYLSSQPWYQHEWLNKVSTVRIFLYKKYFSLCSNFINLKLKDLQYFILVSNFIELNYFFFTVTISFNITQNSWIFFHYEFIWKRRILERVKTIQIQFRSGWCKYARTIFESNTIINLWMIFLHFREKAMIHFRPIFWLDFQENRIKVKYFNRVRIILDRYEKILPLVNLTWLFWISTNSSIKLQLIETMLIIRLYYL